MMQPIAKPCDQTHRAFRKSGTRDPRTIKWVVIHDAEALNAEGVAKYFELPSSQGSAHLVVDDYSCFRTLLDKEIPWAAPGANTKGFHIELCGKAAWTRQVWLYHDMTLRRGAYKAALRCYLYGIPARWVGKWGLKLGVKGLTTHKDCSSAFGGDHYDPGANFPKDVFLAYVRKYLADLKART